MRQTQEKHAFVAELGISIKEANDIVNGGLVQQSMPIFRREIVRYTP